jgi:hypothetical protein
MAPSNWQTKPPEHDGVYIVQLNTYVPGIFTACLYHNGKWSSGVKHYDNVHHALPNYPYNNQPNALKWKGLLEP